MLRCDLAEPAGDLPMFRYRCPHCRQLLQALEIRAGKSTVCAKCSQPLTIPADKAEWLNERGEPLLTAPTVVVPASPPQIVVTPAADPDENPDNDVLGAIYVGEESVTKGLASGLLGYRPAAASGTATIAPTPPTPPEPPRVEPVSPPIAQQQAEQPTPPPTPPEPPTPVVSPPPAVVAAAPVEEPRREPEPPPEPTPTLPPPPSRVPDRPEPRPTAATLPEPTVPNRSGSIPRPGVRSEPNKPTPPRPEPVTTEAHTGGWDRGSPRQPGRLVATTSAPTRRAVEPRPASTSLVPAAKTTEDAGHVSFNDPLSLRSQMDVAAQLTAVLTSRMKPPPTPPRDLRPSTAIWLLATGIGLAMLIVTLFTGNDYTQIVGTIGVVEILLGYLWLVFLAGHRDWKRGLLAAFPPVTLWFLTRWKYAKYRPLRFVVSGAVLLVLAGATDYARPHTRSWSEMAANAQKNQDIESEPKLVQLRHYKEKRAYHQLQKLLETLASTDPTLSQDAKSRRELAVELKELCNHPDAGVKVRALAAFARWGGDDAREMCLTALRSDDPDIRIMALRLLPKWPGPEVARAIATLIGRPSGETSEATKALLEIGGHDAEQAAIALLNRSRTPGTRLVAIDILATPGIGGPDSVAALRKFTKSIEVQDDVTACRLADEKATLIEKRLQNPNP